MDAIQMFVEGSGDVLFLKKLMSVMDPTLAGKWKKCVEPRQDPGVDESQYQIPTLTYKVNRNGTLIVIRAMNGVSKIFPMMEAFLSGPFSYTIDERDARIAKNIFIVDADDSMRKNGTGGIASAHQKIQDEVARCGRIGVGCAGFAMPDDQHDGTLEDILSGMVPEENLPVINGCWRNFVTCAKAHGAPLDPPLKSMIDVYAKIFNSKAHGSIFASSSFGDWNTWNWNASVLNPLKDFLKREVLV